MEVYTTKDGTVSKYVHDDGSETAIKINSSCDGKNSITNKYNVFISSSVGCPVKCKFCYLTAKKYPYHEITSNQIILNVLEAIEHKISEMPELASYYIKISWMGMGDPFFDFNKTIETTIAILNRILTLKLAIGLDGVDFSTTYPNVNITIDDIIKYIARLKRFVSYERIKLNPLRYNRNYIRIFYSMHTMDTSKRMKVMGGLSGCPSVAFDELSRIPPKHATIIIHHLILEGFNDTEYVTNSIINKVNSCCFELRILRYNECEHSAFKESSKYDDLLEIFKEKTLNLKIQHSAGAEVKASCGQFIMKRFI